jgi:two-component system chemotaxis sensor kinase CheA
MDIEDSEFLKRIQITFGIEAEEHLKSFSAGLTDLEKMSTWEDQSGTIETMFRQIHSLKGAARSVGQKDIESVCQPLESLFSALKKQEITMNQAFIDLFYKAGQILSELIETPTSERPAAMRITIRDIIGQMRQMVSISKNARAPEEQVQELQRQPDETSLDLSPEPSPVPDHNKPERQVFSSVVRIPLSKLDPLLLQAEEFIQAKIAINQQADELNGILGVVTEWKGASRQWRGRLSSTSALDWNEWFENNELRLNNLENHLARLAHSLEKELYSFERLVKDHLDAMKHVLMLPVSSITEAFPAMVREISRDQHKDIEFLIHGSGLEIDKRILEEIKDPLIHLIRNSIDHGIGTPAERLVQNKPARGRITLSFTARESGLAEILVSDDGQGIDTANVLKAAMKSGILAKETSENMSHQEIRNLIYHSGVSTSPIITDLSGRGLGLSIVREKVEKLNGRISVESKENTGTTFRILVPMTLATFRGIEVRLGEFRYIIPTMNVERAIRVKHEEITRVENNETILFEEGFLSVVSLAEVLGVPVSRVAKPRSKPGDLKESDHLHLIVVISAETRIAFKVDEILGEQQVLVKGLGKLLNRVRNISGATILGSGKIIPVINTADLMMSAVSRKGKLKEPSGPEIPEMKSEKILVAEDSITSRTLIKNILETAGYQVTTAVDGLDAYTRMKNEAFDLIVSDVDMPRMNGFELTARIKGDKQWAEIPVVLVTALESREDRERGIEAGADAYIIKRSFDQGNLLEVIRKLI